MMGKHQVVYKLQQPKKSHKILGYQRNDLLTTFVRMQFLVYRKTRFYRELTVFKVWNCRISWAISAAEGELCALGVWNKGRWWDGEVHLIPRDLLRGWKKVMNRSTPKGFIWVFPKIVGFPRQIIHFNRVFHDFHHPFWGTPIFGETPIYLVVSEFWLYTAVL